MAAHGVSIVEIALEGGKWTPVVDSKYNRRITADDADDASTARPPGTTG